jgi:hypothetical protein
MAAAATASGLSVSSAVSSVESKLNESLSGPDPRGPSRQSGLLVGLLDKLTLGGAGSANGAAGNGKPSSGSSTPHAWAGSSVSLLSPESEFPVPHDNFGIRPPVVVCRRVRS